MQITEVKGKNHHDVHAFLQLPFEIYKNIPQWVPPLMPGERARFKPNYPFYKHSEAAFFLVRNGAGKAVGRVAVLEHRPHNAYRNKRDALLYLYEAVEEDAVASLLFESAKEWARARGLDRLVGPKGFFTGDGLGLLIEGFEYPPAIGIPYNPPYYVRQWEAVGGMQKEIDYLSAYLRREGFTYPDRIRQIADKVRRRGNYKVPAFKNKAELRAYAKMLKNAYNSAFADLWSYTPIPDEDLDTIVNDLLLIADPRLIKLIFKENTLIGFQLCYPDISEGIRRIKGELWPFGWIVLLLEKRRTSVLNINGNAILPQYQGLGANAVLYDEMFKTLIDSIQHDTADLVQVQESNVRMLADLREVTGAEVSKRHRVYKKQLE